MALEFICSENIIRDEKISIPQNSRFKRANCFRTVSGKIKFFVSNPTIVAKMKEIPKEATEMSFDEYEKHAYNTFYGVPTFYNSQGNII